MDADTSSAIKYGVVAAILAGGVIVANTVFNKKHHPQPIVAAASPAPVAAPAATSPPVAAAPSAPAPASPDTSAPASAPAEASAPAPAPAATASTSAPAPAASQAAAEPPPPPPAPEPEPAAAPAPKAAASADADESTGGLWWKSKHNSAFGVSTVGPTSSSNGKGVAIVFSSDLADPATAGQLLQLLHHGAKVKGDWHASGNARTMVLEGLDAGRYEVKISHKLAGADGKSLGANLSGTVDVW